MFELVALEGFQPSISPFTKRVTTCAWAEPQDTGIQELAFLNAQHLAAAYRWRSAHSHFLSLPVKSHGFFLPFRCGGSANAAKPSVIEAKSSATDLLIALMTKSLRVRPWKAAQTFARRTRPSGTSRKLIVFVSMSSLVSNDTSVVKNKILQWP